MNPAEAQVLLSMAAAFDNRKPDPDAARAWAAALDDLRFEDCRAALIEHYKTSTDYLMPVLIRTAVRRIRAKRIADVGDLVPPPGLSEPETRAWLRETKRRIGDGEMYTPPELPPADPKRLRELIASAHPDPAHVAGSSASEEPPCPTS